jgi:hypothetical protein
MLEATRSSKFRGLAFHWLLQRTSFKRRPDPNARTLRGFSSDMTSLQNVKTRILVLSDTHDGYQQSLHRQEPWSVDGSFQPPLPKVDILIHSGDLTMVGTMEQYRGALKMLSTVNAELKLVIAGNHDLSLHYDYYLNHPKARQITRHHYDPACAEQARELWTGKEAREAGVTYLTEGMHAFELSNGARFSVYASPWQPVFGNWAFNYPLTEDRWNPPHLIETTDLAPDVVPAPPEQDPHPISEGADIDIVITHGPPHGHLDMCSDGYRAGCPHLLKALNRVRPKLHCFGHIHEAWGAEIVKWRTQSEAGGSGRFGERADILGSIVPGGKGQQTPSDPDAIERRANYLDVSSNAEHPLRAGDETLLINSCIMDLEYDAKGSAWLVDIDLPARNA